MSTIYDLWQDANTGLKPEDIPWVAMLIPYQQLHASVIPVPVANIATDLGPKLKPLLNATSTARIVGHDGGPVTTEGYVWDPMIRGLLERGVKIDYVLTADRIPAETIACFASIAKSLKNPGGLRLFRSVPERNPAWEGFLQEIKTFHFVVTENPMTLWLETNQPTSLPKAYNCYFFPEDAARETKLGEEYIERFDSLVREVCEQVPLG